MSQSPVCLLMLMSEDIQNSNVIVTNKKKKKVFSPLLTVLSGPTFYSTQLAASCWEDLFQLLVIP